MEEFDFFISHSSHTKEIARALYYSGQSNGIWPWYDEHLLSLGDQLKSELEVGISSSKCFLLLFNKTASEGAGVELEMKIAQKRYLADKTFRIIVVRLDDTPLPEDFWNDFLYHDWSKHSEYDSITRLLEAISGKKGLLGLASASVLTAAPSQLFENRTGAVAEHTRNYVLQMVSEIKALMRAVVSTGYDSEMRDTIDKLTKTFLFESVHSYSGGLRPITDGMYEAIHGNRMRVAPVVSIKGLPNRYRHEVPHNDEISTRIRFLWRDTGEPVNSPVPFKFAMSLNARM